MIGSTWGRNNLTIELQFLGVDVLKGIGHGAFFRLTYFSGFSEFNFGSVFDFWIGFVIKGDLTYRSKDFKIEFFSRSLRFRGY